MALRTTLAILAMTTALLPCAALAEMTVVLGAPWDGKVVPADQICQLRGGNGSTPPMNLSGLPKGTVRVLVEYNDMSYYSMAFDGGHGALSFPATAPEADLPSVPAMTAELPHGALVVSAARATGRFASSGYLPPCSGGRGHMYAATIKALAEDGTVLDAVTLDMGRY